MLHFGVDNSLLLPPLGSRVRECVGPLSRRRGVTLVELLVVIVILMMLAAVAVPAMRPALEGRRIREAARAVNVYLSSARIRAVELGRPCGVFIERFENQPECSMVLHQAEVPPPYAGDTLNATVEVWNLGTNYWADGSIILKLGVAQGTMSNGLIRRGDLVQINHQGPWFTIVEDPMDSANGGHDWDFPEDGDGFVIFSDPNAPDPNTPPAEYLDENRNGHIDNWRLTVRLDSGQVRDLPWPIGHWSPQRVPFTILRQPVKSAATPLQLPAGAVIDMTASGRSCPDPSTLTAAEEAQYDPNNYSFAPLGGSNQPVMIMFSPNGALDKVCCPCPMKVVDPLFLLIGKRERVESPPTGSNMFLDVAVDDLGVETDEDKNWEDMDSLWVTIRPHSGTVTVAENYSGPGDHADALPDGNKWWAWFWQSRQFAREAQTMGGR